MGGGGQKSQKRGDVLCEWPHEIIQQILLANLLFLKSEQLI